MTGNLVPKQILRADGVLTTVYVRPEDAASMPDDGHYAIIAAGPVSAEARQQAEETATQLLADIRVVSHAHWDPADRAQELYRLGWRYAATDDQEDALTNLLWEYDDAPGTHYTRQVAGGGFYLDTESREVGAELPTQASIEAAWAAELTARMAVDNNMYQTADHLLAQGLHIPAGRLQNAQPRDFLVALIEQADEAAANSDNGEGRYLSEERQMQLAGQEFGRLMYEHDVTRKQA